MKLFASIALLAVAASAQAVTLTKSPDRGAYWNPLSPSGTYVYANSFVANGTGVVTEIGAWMNTTNFDATTEVVFHVVGSVAGDALLGPSMSNILATSSALSGMSGSLALYTAGIQSSAVLTAGETYWFAASTIGSSGNGTYQFGGHTQNSEGIVDNGTFWYSNDAAGAIFDGVSLTPELAFTVSIGERMAADVPDSGSTLALLGFAVTGLGLLRRRSR